MIRNTGNKSSEAMKDEKKKEITKVGMLFAAIFAGLFAAHLAASRELTLSKAIVVIGLSVPGGWLFGLLFWCAYGKKRQ
jgi:hypothetical protein